MSEENKTSWRKAFDSPYLASWDIDKRITLTIGRVVNEQNKMRKKVMHNVAYFEETEIRKGEKMKPMILNATNCKAMHEISGSLYIQDWVGARVCVYVEEGIRGADGNETQGLRIMMAQRLPELTAAHAKWDGAVESYRKNKNLDAVKKHFTVSDVHEKMIIEASKVEVEA